ncbi:MAG: hypothetical protein ACXABY_22345 [Candidatus Thorarchaeota archaeon]|jgi:hypothetical protein
MALYEPIRDAFREWNRLLIDRQEWDAKHQLAREDMKLRGQLMDSQLADAQLNREWNQAKFEEYKSDREPVEFSLYNFMQGDEDLVTNENLPELRHMFGISDDAQFNRAGGYFMDAQGQPLKMSRRALKTSIPFLQAWVNGKEDRVGKMAGERIRTSAQLTALDKQLTTLQNDGRKDMKAIENVVKMKSNIQTKLNQIDQFFSPEGQIQYWTERANVANEAAAASQALGLSGMASIYQNQAIEAGKSQRTAMAQMATASTSKGSWTVKPVYKNGKEVARAKFHTSGKFIFQGRLHDSAEDLPEGYSLTKPTTTGQDRWTKVTDRVSRDFAKLDAEGNFIGITEGLEGQHRVAQRFANDLMREHPEMPGNEVVIKLTEFARTNDETFVEAMEEILNDKDMNNKQKAEMIAEDYIMFVKAFRYTPSKFKHSRAFDLYEKYGR